MLTRTRSQAPANVLSALAVRSQLGRILGQVDRGRRSYVIEKRGVPKAILLGIKDYMRLAAPEPEILRVIGEESRRNKTDRMSSRRIEAMIRRARKDKRTADA